MSNVLIVSAESSSGLYAQRLIEIWKHKNLNLDIFGVGSKKLESLGVRCIGRSEDMAVVGIYEVFKHLKHIKTVFKNILDECDRVKPEWAILLDYPDFNLRLAKELKKRGIKVFYYISPQLWAWRKGRIEQIKKYVDHMIVIFPFEENYYKDRGVDAKFFGHPLIDELENQILTDQQILEFRQKYGVKEGQKVIGMMPGSRQSELKHHLSIQLKVAEILENKNENLRFFLLKAPEINRNLLKEKIGNTKASIVVIERDPLEMLQLVDFVLCKSGTSTLLSALMKKPGVIMYVMNKITVVLSKVIMKRPKFMGMPNLIRDKEIMKEYFQEEAHPVQISEQISKLVHDTDQSKVIIEEYTKLKNQLGQKGVSDRVSNFILGEMGLLGVKK